jgi:chromosome segregation ATPase
LDTAKAAVDEEASAKAEAQAKLSRANAELAQLRSGKGGAGVSSEALEEVKRKYASKLAEAEEAAEKALTKVSGLEKTKSRLQSELDELAALAEKSGANAAALERKQKVSNMLFLWFFISFSALTFLFSTHLF